MVLTDEGWVVIDGGNSPKHGQAVVDAMRIIHDMPVRYVVNTHRHFDHVFGNQAYNAPVISGRRCQERFLDNIKDDWSAEHAVDWLKKTIFSYNDQLTEADFDDYFPVPPSEVFDNEYTLELSPITLNFFPLDGVHSDDGVGIWIPEEKAVFLGDAFYYQYFSAECRATPLPTLVDRVAQLNAEIFIPGHERVHNREVFDKLQNYVHLLINIASKQSPDVSAEDVVQAHPFPEEFKHVSFLSESFHFHLINALLKER
jgi:glyoxylase-like metal-dependent hydrolase (beta-lactamase superfamily II)